MRKVRLDDLEFEVVAIRDMFFRTVLVIHLRGAMPATFLGAASRKSPSVSQKEGKSRLEKTFSGILQDTIARKSSTHP
jgi:hypothetical protein